MYTHSSEVDAVHVPCPMESKSITFGNEHEIFQVVLQQTMAAKLGDQLVPVNVSDTVAGLLITSIHSGDAIDRHNQGAVLEQPISEGDVIVGVLAGDQHITGIEEMFQQIQAQYVVTLVVCRVGASREERKLQSHPFASGGAREQQLSPDFFRSDASTALPLDAHLFNSSASVLSAEAPGQGQTSVSSDAAKRAINQILQLTRPSHLKAGPIEIPEAGHGDLESRITAEGAPEGTADVQTANNIKRVECSMLGDLIEEYAPAEQNITSRNRAACCGRRRCRCLVRVNCIYELPDIDLNAPLSDDEDEDEDDE